MKAELLFEIEPMLINKIEDPVSLQLGVVKLGKMLELCDSMELLGEGNESTKLEVLKEHLESTLQNGQKAIIITRFSRMGHILERELGEWRPLLITGATQRRQDILDRFSKDSECRLLIGTEAIAQGLNLQVANILYNYDSAWNPAKMEQRAGRVYRNGQQRAVFIYNLVVKKSLEVWMQKKLEAKAELSATLLPKSLTELKEILS
jgi:SNF2 family DNA or RNA helicase